MTLLEEFNTFRTEMNTTIDAYDNCIENACMQFDTKQFEFFKEELKVKDTNSFFVEVILGSIFIGFAGIVVKEIANKIFTPMIKTRAMVIQKGNMTVVSSLTDKELQNFKNTILPSGMNFLADDTTESFAKQLFTNVFDQAGEKLIDRALESKSNDQSKTTFSSSTDDFKTQFKEKIDFWTGQFKKQQNKSVDKIVSILAKQEPDAALAEEFKKELGKLRSELAEVDTIEEMRQIRYYYELCLWSILYQYILFHGIEETRNQTYNDTALRQARTGNFQYPEHFNDIRNFNLPKKIPKNVYSYWVKQFPHPLAPTKSFEEFYKAIEPTIDKRYNVSINQGGYKKTTDPKYLKPLLDAEMFYDLSNYMMRIADQFNGKSKFTQIVSGGPK